MAKIRKLPATASLQQDSITRRDNHHRIRKPYASAPLRRSARLTSNARESPRRPRNIHKATTPVREPKGTKRSRNELENPAHIPSVSCPPKRQRIACPGRHNQSSAYQGRIDYWRKEGHWPAEPLNVLEQVAMSSHLCKRRSSTQSLRRKRSGSDSLFTSSNSISSDQRSRDEKCSDYQNPRYKILLETKNSFMYASPLDITESSKSWCQTLLESPQIVPEDTLFRDDIFDQTCRRIDDRNEARLVQDITRLIVPSAETLATFGAKELDVLVESVNEGWNSSVKLTSTRPQPDYAVGFGQQAFSPAQREKLSPHLGRLMAGDQSVFMATYYMFFPFLTCEVKCGAAALDVADRQNAHSMTLAIRAIIELFHLVGRKTELDREILAFSFSHDHRSVRIYGHYAVVKESETSYYRHLVHEFSLRALGGKEKWTAYKFVKNVYTKWMPTHLERLRSAIDALPTGVDFDVPPLSQVSVFSQESVCSDQPDTGLPSPDASSLQQGSSKRRQRTRQINS